jgi:hydroxyacylglutathione hydrolase
MYKFELSPQINLFVVPALKDNYCYLVEDLSSQTALVIDPSESQPVEEALEKQSLRLTQIVNTHHHPDHTGGNLELKRKHSCEVIGPAKESDKVPGLDRSVSQGDTLIFGTLKFEVIDVPGHTMGHMALFEREQLILFSGDVLFCYGCGRVFEGTHNMMKESLEKLSRLPDNTRVFCGHEYALQNLEFALRLEPENKLLKLHFERVKELRARRLPSVPTLIKDELETNPFLRIGQTDEAFSQLRTLKDQFKPTTKL